MLPRLTIRPASLFFSRGRNSRVRATSANRLILKMLWSSLSVDALTRISSLPECDSMNFAMQPWDRLHWSHRVDCLCVDPFDAQFAGSLCSVVLRARTDDDHYALLAQLPCSFKAH